ncbi:hypothetical protein NX862_09780 [Rhodobacter sp. KR11]|jgi:hypothetical protein|uniref:hypothetical protein n=1 Tax=Rhodobacter sp. KR11 TaxID=2974588 RepID=UPI002222E5F1|nr:hypothetical protein [Rhodobacter sp. KR11]MCW1919046.1 hypothetical protein [Rhodobacter sp. KR11]
MKQFVGALVCAIGICGFDLQAKADVVVTDLGFFSDCYQAVAYRDGTLFEMLSANIDSYDPEFEARIDATITEFATYRDQSQSIYDAATDEMKKRMAAAAAKFIFFDLLADRGLEAIPQTFKDAYSVQDWEAFEAVVKEANALKARVMEEAITGKPFSDDYAIGRAQDILKDFLQSKASKLAGPHGALFLKVGFLGMDGLEIYLDTLPRRKEGEAEFGIYADAIAKLHEQSKQAPISFLNKVKNQIDSACSPG